MNPNPLTVIATNDPGDQTQRNFRYQHAYGVILLIGAATKKLPFTAIYAEHHEDYLCEREDGKFDAYQVKTRKAEEGLWDLSDEPLRKSIKRFTQLYQLFGELIGDFSFVSNSDYSNPSPDSKDSTKIRRSPRRFLDHACQCSSHSNLSLPYTNTFKELLVYCDCQPEVLFATLKKIKLVLGPERNSFDAEICATHLPTLSECANHSMPVLNGIKDELIQRVYYASSLKIDEPSKHWHPNYLSTPDNPIIKAKRISVNDLMLIIADRTAPPFRYSNTHSTLNLGTGEGNLDVMRKKMIKGDLVSQVETMERRSLSTEQLLIGYAHQKPLELNSILNQLVGVVKGECDEAFLVASLSGEPFGRLMLDDVYKRLKDKATNDSSLVWNERFETLIGIAGLLTGECQVWWSEPFLIAGEYEPSTS